MSLPADTVGLARGSPVVTCILAPARDPARKRSGVGAGMVARAALVSMFPASGIAPSSVLATAGAACAPVHEADCPEVGFCPEAA